MKLSSRGHYGLRALAHLAQKGSHQPVPLRQIAQSEQIPEAFLEQIFLDLRKAGIVKSIRGAKGGYKLASPPKDIIVGNIVRVLEGSFNIIDCLEDEDGNCCTKTEDCTTKIVWEKVRDSMAMVLDGMNLADLSKSGKGLIDSL